ncbi:hypothetical protein NP569_25685, partial [Vibrio parahaemolyticus]|nr:hypothetical protein [Vibrio parahaemolyticus]
MSNSVGSHGPPNVDYASAVWHLVFIRVLTGVIIIKRMHNTQIEKKFIQDLEQHLISLHDELGWVALLVRLLRRGS